MNPGPDGASTVRGNATDPTNRSAPYIGTTSCRQCHPDVSDLQFLHGHANVLTRVTGAPPEFPDVDPQPTVPNPPQGFDWSDISYVIGGYTKKALFIDQDGFILGTGVNGANTQWNLPFPANGTEAGFVPHDASGDVPTAFDYSCFQCHTTGAQPQDEDDPQFQDGRPGFAGSWQEPGVQCEECHGPGGNHFSTVNGEVQIDTTGIFVSAAADRCGECHTRGANPAVIVAENGFINHNGQWPELLASGAHASFTCTTCHDPHASVIYDRTNAIRNDCSACHADVSMASHDGAVYQNGAYTETLSCESCHMPLATRSATSSVVDVILDNGDTTTDQGRIGDTRTHIFRISTDAADASDFFNPDGSAVATDELGRAAVTVDFACLRCHNGTGNVFGLTVERAAEIAIGMHGL
jgi:hypothetical protein